MLKVDEGVVPDLLDTLHRGNGRESLFEVSLRGAEHEVANVYHLHLVGEGGERGGESGRGQWESSVGREVQVGG